MLYSDQKVWPTKRYNKGKMRGPVEQRLYDCQPLELPLHRWKPVKVQNRRALHYARPSSEELVRMSVGQDLDTNGNRARARKPGK